METTLSTRSIKPTFNLLKITFGIVPIVAGLDKFTNFLTHWDAYLSPGIIEVLPFPVHTFMMIIGVIEILAGILVLLRPAIGGLVVAGWLTLIAVALLAGAQFFDLAVRDLVMAVGAFSLARLSKFIS
jgi:hypothetical protein